VSGGGAVGERRADPVEQLRSRRGHGVVDIEVSAAQQRVQSLAARPDPRLLPRQVGVQLGQDLAELATVVVGEHVGGFVEAQAQLDQPPGACQAERVSHPVDPVPVGPPWGLGQQPDTVVVTDRPGGHSDGVSKLPYVHATHEKP
jgi:hypothetical protein